ncbi:HU family DNA-binding protein [bacterium]|nr:HU family DNA-binding protein [bacterium]
MTKADLVDVVAQKVGQTKKLTAQVIDQTLEAIAEALKKGEKVQLIGFGSFEVRKRAARKGINPRTRKPINIPAKSVPVFRPGKDLREAVK